jgi:hypothetical protein
MNIVFRITTWESEDKRCKIMEFIVLLCIAGTVTDHIGSVSPNQVHQHWGKLANQKKVSESGAIEATTEENFCRMSPDQASGQKWDIRSCAFLIAPSTFDPAPSHVR